VPFVPADFADDTDLERVTVARLGAARPDADGTTYDLRGQKRGAPLCIERTLTASTGSKRARRFVTPYSLLRSAPHTRSWTCSLSTCCGAMGHREG
jgi:hypothetical protein